MSYEKFAASKFETELYRAIALKRADVLEKLAAGSIDNIGQYKYWTGYIAALKDMNDMIVAVRKKLNT